MTSRGQGLFPPHPFFKGKALGTRLVRVEDRRSGLCMSTVLSPVIKDHLSIYFICLFNI